MNLRLLLLIGLLAAAPGRADDVFMSNLYDPEYDTAGIERFSPSGQKSLFAPMWQSAPNGLTFDNQGNLYVASLVNNNIMKFDPAGNGSIYASTGLDQPVVLAFGSGGILYVANVANNAAYIEKITPNGQATLFASGLYQPQGIACDASGNVYVSSWINNNSATAILKYDLAGNRTTFAITSSLGIPRGLTFYGGNLYATFGNSVQRYAPNGTRTVAANTGLVNAIGVAFDSAGYFYVTDQGTASIMKFSPAGVGSVFASGLNIPAYIAIPPPVVPEPSGLALCALGLGLFLTRRATAS